MTTRQKAEAFDRLAVAMTNQWYDGQWSWHCGTPSGGPMRDTREEAIADLIEWSKRRKKKRTSLKVIK